MAERDGQEPDPVSSSGQSGPDVVAAQKGATRARFADEPASRAHEPEQGEAPLGRSAAELFEKVEPLVRENRWSEVVALLGPLDRASELPSALSLVYAMALAETAGEGSTTDANMLAIQSVAALLALPSDSHTALMVAKRVLRRNPIAWRSRPAPKAPVRMALVVVALTLGIVAGWAVGPGSIRLQEIIETAFP